MNNAEQHLEEARKSFDYVLRPDHPYHSMSGEIEFDRVVSAASEGDVDNISRLIDALQSGGYRKGKWYLRFVDLDGDHNKVDWYCCLGVHCDINKEQHGIEWAEFEDSPIGAIAIRSGQAWVGEYLPRVFNDSVIGRFETILASINDSTDDWGCPDGVVETLTYLKRMTRSILDAQKVG